MGWIRRDSAPPRVRAPCAPRLLLQRLALLLALLGVAQAGALSVAYQYPCKSASEFFDTATLTCQACDQASGFYVAADGLSCALCDGTAGSDAAWAAGFVAAAAWEPAALSGGKCVCATTAQGRFVAEIADGGRRYGRCLVCPATAPADGAGACVPASGGGRRTAAGDLKYVVETLNARGAGISLDTATRATIQAVREPSGVSLARNIEASAPLARWLGPAARSCMDDGSRQGCNAVANLCALQQYSPDAAACVLYDELVLLKQSGARRPQASSAAPRPETGPLPWLLYAAGTDYLAAADVQLTVSLAPDAPRLRLVLSEFDLDGTWLGLADWGVQLQACGAGAGAADAWTRFGTSYEVSCAVGVASLRALADYSGSGPRLCDPYLVQDDGSLYPIPVRVTNRPGSVGDGQPIGHVRRFFFVDDTLATEAAGGAPHAVVYPASMRLEFMIRADRRDHITPPVLTITYAALQAGDSPEAAAARAPATFAVSYLNPPALIGSFWYAWQTMLVVLLVLGGGPVWVWRVVLYMRRRASQPLDIELVLYGALAAVDVFSGALVAVLALVSLYWLALAKLQARGAEDVHLLVPPDSGMYNFWVTMVLAVVGQSVGLLWTIYQQTNVDVFFLDWEKPRRVLAKGGGKEEAAPVSCWRTLLAARLTYPPFTLAMVVLLLDGANFASASALAPGGPALPPAAAASLQRSMLLRFGAAAGWFLVLGVGQWLWKTAIVHRFFGHPLSNFVDLLFLANASAVVLDERAGGYYLHGRNQMHHADTTLAKLNASLMREEEGLVAKRGLVTTYAGGGGPLGGSAQLNDGQTFTLHITDELRRLYESTLLAQVEQAAMDQRLSRGVVTSAVRGPLRPREGALSASRAISAAFAAALDEAERNHATQVLVPTYWQRVFRLPPESAAGSRTILVHDFHNAWASALLYGAEARLYTFEAILFCAVDSAARNAAVTGLVVLVAWLGLRAVRLHFGETNLSRKTLVDRRFLI
ncbi:MAG: Meckelin [Monoraphidium minutum]|nr:MAG: Meckelin [Monoraphidium minutum]